MPKTVLITGATSGFGKACAYKYAEAGWNLILTGRRIERLEEIKIALEKQYNINVKTCCFDVRERAAVELALQFVLEQNFTLDVLVNNAGLALGRASFEESDLNDWDTMLDTNVKGLLYVSKIVAQKMKQQQYGHIVNIGSIAGKEVYPWGNVYCASKHAVDAITKAMRVDLVSYNIKVTAVHPGAAETEFSIVRYKGDTEKAKKMYENYTPLSAQDIADTVFYVTNLPPHVCINDLVIMPTAQASGTVFHKSE